MVGMHSATAPARLDARPLRPIADETPWDEARIARDRLLAVVSRTLATEGVEALLLTSQGGNYPVWLRLEAWLPEAGGGPGASRRSDLDIMIDVKPLRRHRLVYSVRSQRSKRLIAIAGRTKLEERDVEEWVRYAIGRGSRPSSFTPLLDGLRQSAAWLVPAVAPGYNPTGAAFRPPLVDAFAVAALAIGVILAAAHWFAPAIDYAGPLIGGLGVIGSLLLVLFGRVERRDWVAAEPRDAPRHLGHIDSWHAVLAGLATSEQSLKQRLMAHLAGNFRCHLENYGHRTANGYEERERLVISHGQGQIHLHLAVFGNDLFVGWQAYLNWAQWAETPPVGRKAIGRADVVYRELMPAWYIPSQFDLIDLDSLSAVVQRAVESEVRALIREQESDQEIDFEITRGDRGDALDQRSVWPERQTERTRNSNRFLGTAPARRVAISEMKLAPIGAPEADAGHGLAKVPAVLLLPAIAALGYFAIFNAGLLPAFRFSQPVGSGLTYTFLPLFHLPVAVAIGLGLLLYAKARLLHALLAVLLVEALTFCIGYAYNLGLARLITQRDLAVPAIFYQVVAGGYVAGSLACLLAAAAWAPLLRERRRWLWALLLWPLWSVAALWIIREQRIGGGAGNAIVWSSRIFVAATIGYWLARDAAAVGIGARVKAWAGASTTTARPPAAKSRTAVDPDGQGGWRKAGLTLVFLAVAALALAAMQSLPMGTPDRLGPAAFPSFLAVLLFGFGLFALLGKRAPMPVGTAGVRSMLTVAVAGAIVVFGLPVLGLVATAACAGAITATASSSSRPADLVIGALGGAMIAYGVVVLMGFPVSLWPDLGRL